MNGYMGKLLFVDLSKKTTEVRELSEDIARNFLGGPALGAKILYDEMPKEIDAFDEKSMIGFVTGPLNNTGALYGGRYTVVSKSPVTNGWNDANSGGYFGEGLRKSGYDAVFVSGISETPVYIYINNGSVKIIDAPELWGLTTKATEKILKEKHGEKTNAALIGPAGENLSYFAAVMNDSHRAAGRGGSGAVMGSKKLKAVVVNGDLKTPVFDAERVSAINAEITKYSEESEAARYFAVYGTGRNYKEYVAANDTGIKNWTGSPEDFSEEEADKIGSHAYEKYKKSRYFCSQCKLGCSAMISMSSEWKELSDTTRPEYETMGAFGAMMLNSDPEAVAMANELCNEYGFDTMSAGSTIAWAMECYINGVITKEQLDGIDLTWGNGKAIVALIEKICKDEGIGKILKYGTRKAAEELGGKEYLVVANGIEKPQHDSRYFYGLGRTYASDPTPGRHVKGGINSSVEDEGFDPVESLKGTGVEDLMAVIETEIMNSSGMCSFGVSYGNPNDAMIRNINAVTGFGYTASELYFLGIRMFTMRHAFNLREGIDRRSFEMSKRFYKSNPPDKGLLAGLEFDFNVMIDNFYNTLGWTKEGVPQKRTLEMLGGMDAVINDMYELDVMKAEVSRKDSKNAGLSKYFMRGNS